MSSSTEPHYEYRWEDHSLLTRYLREPVFVPLVHALPRRITPNQVTVFGHLIVWLTVALVLALDEPSAWLIAAMGVSFLAYALADCIDGMFARYTQRTSRLGELLDHGFDAVSLPLVSLGIGIAMRLPPWLILASTGAVAFMTFATFVHGYRVGYVVLGAIGSLEGIAAAGVVCLAAVVLGVERLAMPVALGMSTAGWLAVAIVGGSFFALGSMKGLARYLDDFASLALLCAATIAWYRFGRISVGATGMLLVAVCAYQVCLLTCSRLVRAPLRLWDIGLLVLVLGGAAISLTLQPSAGVQTMLAALGPAYVLVRGGLTFTRAIHALGA
jgi:phosphatidylglycerophosphate synthase